MTALEQENRYVSQTSLDQLSKEYAAAYDRNNQDDPTYARECRSYLNRVALKEIQIQMLAQHPDWRVEFSTQGQVRISNGRQRDLIYCLGSGKWRQEGKSVWYRSKGFWDFFSKYCLREPQNN